MINILSITLSILYYFIFENEEFLFLFLSLDKDSSVVVMIYMLTLSADHEYLVPRRRHMYALFNVDVICMPCSTSTSYVCNSRSNTRLNYQRVNINGTLSLYASFLVFRSDLFLARFCVVCTPNYCLTLFNALFYCISHMVVIHSYILQLKINIIFLTKKCLI